MGQNAPGALGPEFPVEQFLLKPSQSVIALRSGPLCQSTAGTLPKNVGMYLHQLLHESQVPSWMFAAMARIQISTEVRSIRRKPRGWRVLILSLASLPQMGGQFSRIDWTFAKHDMSLELPPTGEMRTYQNQSMANRFVADTCGSMTVAWQSRCNRNRQE